MTDRHAALQRIPVLLAERYPDKIVPWGGYTIIAKEVGLLSPSVVADVGASHGYTALDNREHIASTVPCWSCGKDVLLDRKEDRVRYQRTGRKVCSQNCRYEKAKEWMAEHPEATILETARALDASTGVVSNWRYKISRELKGDRS